MNMEKKIFISYQIITSDDQKILDSTIIVPKGLRIANRDDIDGLKKHLSELARMDHHVHIKTIIILHWIWLPSLPPKLISSIS